MLKQVYEIDEFGYLKEIYVAEVSENGDILDKDKIQFISTDPPEGLYKIKWNGNEWTEGETETERLEREEKKSQQSPPLPSQEERIKMLEDTINFLLEL